MKKTTRDVIVMLAIMILSAVTYFFVIPSQIKVSSDADFTNRTFPQFTIAVIFIAATAGLVEALIKARKDTQTASQKEKATGNASPHSRFLPFLGFLLILAYALVFWFVGSRFRGFGFPVATALFIPAFLALLRCKNWRYYAAAYGFATVMYLIFRFVLNVMLR